MVKLRPSTKRRIEELKIVHRETIDDVIIRLLDAAASERREAASPAAQAS